MKSKNSKKYKYFRIVGIILFLYILSRIDLQQLLLSLKSIDFFYFFFAIILLPLFLLFGILKWKILINSQNLKISFRPLIEAFLKGFFLGTITPGKLGELWKAKYLTNIVNISQGKAFYTALMERLIDVIIMIMVGVVAVIDLLLLNEIKEGWLMVFLLLILIFFTSYFLVKKEQAKKLFKFLLKSFTPSSIKEKTDSFFDEFFEGLKQLNSTVFLKLMSCGFIFYLTSVLIYYFLALSLGIEISFLHLFLIVALVRFLILIPITFLGLGTREAGYIFFFSIFNINAPLAVAFSILIFLTTILSSIPGALLFLKGKQP